jgi:hypothetical protein
MPVKCGPSAPKPLVSAEEEQLLREYVAYLNLEEMAAFCRAHSLPTFIQIERPTGGLKRTGDRDRKDIVLGRILALALEGKRLGPTVYGSNVVSEEPLPARLGSRVRLHYGQYDRGNRDLMSLLRELTDGAFKNGMIARLVLRDYWTAGEAPTLRAFADAWVRAKAAHTEPRPEAAYLADRHRGKAGRDWKTVRREKAALALEILAKSTSPG